MYYRKNKYKSNWKRKNRKQFRHKIHHSKYISKPTNSNNTLNYIPENSFFDFGINDLLLENIKRRNFVNPTKIQDIAIPAILKGRDLIAIAKTGSGKTGAFLIPMINKVLNDRNNKVLIICPTRELANQIQNEFLKFSKNLNLRTCLLIGGKNIRTQISRLNQRPHFVIATPGRLLDIDRRGAIKLINFNNIVLDEVDQMLAMGFIEDIKKIISELPKEKQSLFFSATLSKKEEEIANSLLVNPIKFEVDDQEALRSIEQDIIKVKNKESKLIILHELISKKEFYKVLVFSETKKGADKISKHLKNKGIRADSLHGNKTQNNRLRILSNFRQDKINVLVATDVASRGIDIPNISHVINFDEPANYNDYIHRVGRTGRMGKKGSALTFVIKNKNINT